MQTLMHPGTGERVHVGGWFSWPCLMFGPFWFAWRRMFGTAVLAGIGVIVTLLWGWLVLPFIANRLFRRHLIKQGFVDVAAVPPSGQLALAVPALEETPQEAIHAMFRDVAAIPVNLGACMDCGSGDSLKAHTFGFARVLNVDYAGTTASAGVSAVSMLLGGPGMIMRPKTTANIVRSQLVLCQACLGRRKGFLGVPHIADKDYALHPWATAARRHGYTTFLSDYQLARYRPAR